MGHAFSRRDVIEGAWNLKHWPFMSYLLLHGEYDLNHHRRPEVPWRKIVGLRNLLAHGYWTIDAEELWDIARNKVPKFVAELRPLLEHTE